MQFEDAYMYINARVLHQSRMAYTINEKFPFVQMPCTLMDFNSGQHGDC